MEDVSHQRAAESILKRRRQRRGGGGAGVNASPPRTTTLGRIFVWSLRILPKSAWGLPSYSGLGTGELASLSYLRRERFFIYVTG